MQTVMQDLASIGIKLDLSKEAKTLNKLSDLTRDRKNWRGIVRRVVQHYAVLARRRESGRRQHNSFIGGYKLQREINFENFASLERRTVRSILKLIT